MMKIKKIPVRTCVGCRQTKTKKELIRVVRTPGGEIVADLSGKANGRGAYICPDLSCLDKASSKRALVKALDADIDTETLAVIEREIKAFIKGGTSSA